jgi:hypothetical protein
MYEVASPSSSDVYRYVIIIKFLDYVFNIDRHAGDPVGLSARGMDVCILKVVLVNIL